MRVVIFVVLLSIGSNGFCHLNSDYSTSEIKLIEKRINFEKYWYGYYYGEGYVDFKKKVNFLFSKFTVLDSVDFVISQ